MPELSDLKLFRITNGSAQELKGKSVALEVSLQRLIEANMETLFGVRFLATEYSTGAKHRGRIDSLRLDETGSPVIFAASGISARAALSFGSRMLQI